MAEVTKQAREMYDSFRFGRFAYERDQFNLFLLDSMANFINGNKKIYDIGCGTGHWLEKCLEFGAAKENLMGVDLSAQNVQELKSRGFNARCSSVLELDFEDDLSDFTICSGVIHHTNDPFKAFNELVRITKNGGYIYISVYNKFNPYFYIVHKATYPIRYLYWKWNKRIANYFYQMSKIIFQPISYVILGKFLDDRTGKTLFMDQVITPRAILFSKSILNKYAEKCNCQVQTITYQKYYLMLDIILKVQK